MQKRIEKAVCRGQVQAPPSKSMAHRLLIGAAVCEGESRIENLSLCADVRATINGLRALGADIQIQNNTAVVRGGLHRPGQMDCGDSASTLRLLLPLCLLQKNPSLLKGSPRLLQRPMGIYETICRESGLHFVQKADGIEVCGRLCGGQFAVPGNVSSQFVSGLLVALPFSEGDSVIRLLPPVESRPYIDMTVDVLRRYGIEVQHTENEYFIHGGQTAHPTDSMVEGDYSAAAYLAALGDVEVTGLSEDSLQGDRIYPNCFEAIRQGTPTLDVADCPDLAPVLMAMAAICHGAVLTGTHRLKWKESSRAVCMASELSKCGASVTVEENRVTISGALHAPTQMLSAHEDHRIAMALTAVLVRVGGVLDGAEATEKSFPAFWDTVKALQNEGTTNDF